MCFTSAYWSCWGYMPWCLFKLDGRGRLSALTEVGLSYSSISSDGYEIPVVSIEIKYKIALKLGETIYLKTCFYLKMVWNGLQGPFLKNW